MGDWRRMNGGGNAASGGAVVMVAVDATKEMSSNTLEWAIRNVVRTMDGLILVALLKPTTSSAKVQSQVAASNASSDGNKFLGSLRRKFGRRKGSVKDKDSDSSTDTSNDQPRQNLGFDDEGVKWIYEVCLDMLSDLCCENDVEQVKAQVKVVPCANISSVANIAEEHRAHWVILDRRLKKESECCMRRLNCNIITVNNAIPNVLKTVKMKEMEEEYEKADLLSLLTSMDKSSSATSSLKSTNSSTSRSSASSSDQESSGAAPPTMPGGIFASRQPALRSDSPKNQQRKISPLPLPPGRRLLDNVSRFKMHNAEGITRGRMSVDSAVNPRNEPKPTTLGRHSIKYRDTGTNNTSVGTEQLVQDSWSRDPDNTRNKTETKPTTKLSKFEDKSIGVATEPNMALSNSTLPTTLNRSSSIRTAMSVSIKQPRTPPPLCSVCRYNAPVFGKPPRKFSYKEMEIATDGFSKENFLAEGGYGPVYRGVLEDGQVVAVKKHKEASAQGAAEFCSEVDVLSCAQHKNLVMLVGYCVEKDEWLLVYEFACNGSLDKHLHGIGKEVMAWKHRQKVATGAARGLRYLHEDCRVGCIVHRDLRPNNILLTHDFEAMVGDFGLARWQMDGQSAEETRIVGTLGYLAPEYTQTGQITEKADVYAFGVLMMELITGVKAIDLIRRGMHLRRWATPLIEKMKVHELIDPRLKGRYEKREAERMMHVAGLCVSPDPATRPRMAKVLRLLEGDMEIDRASHQQTQIRSSISENTDNMSHRLSKILSPISRSVYGASRLRSLTPPTTRARNEGESAPRSKTPPPPSRFSDNPSRLHSRRPISMSRLSDSASHQQYQAPSMPTNSDNPPCLCSKTPPMSRPKMYLPSHVRSSTLFEYDYMEDTNDLHAQEELRSNNIMKPTPWMQTDNAAIHEMEEVSNRGILDQDDETTTEYQAYLRDSFFQFIQNTKGTIVDKR